MRSFILMFTQTLNIFSMKSKAYLLLVVSFFVSALSSCDKDDDDNKNTNLVVKTGLPVTGAQENPAKTSTASGTLDVSYDKLTKKLSFTVNYTGLTGTPTGAHIHGTAARGTN